MKTDITRKTYHIQWLELYQAQSYHTVIMNCFRVWLIASPVPNHNLNRWWHIVNFTHRSKRNQIKKAWRFTHCDELLAATSMGFRICDHTIRSKITWNLHVHKRILIHPTTFISIYRYCSDIYMVSYEGKLVSELKMQHVQVNNDKIWNL